MSQPSPYIFLDELIISTKFDREVDKFGNISWEKISSFVLEENHFTESLKFKQIFCDGDGWYTMCAEYKIGDMLFGFNPSGTLEEIYDRCEKFKQFYLSLNNLIF